MRHFRTLLICFTLCCDLLSYSPNVSAGSPKAPSVQMRFDTQHEARVEDLSFIMDENGILRDSAGHEIDDLGVLITFRPDDLLLRIVINVEDEEKTPIRRLVLLCKKLQQKSKGRQILLLIATE